ncbi:MAG TPA: response regulator [Burkholderiaceae bacterium]|jgi:twitching motility two-component system response regulator PilH|nr:response regulator [Burkholderiaceae bacterium]
MSVPAPDRSGCGILVVDDVATERERMLRILQDAGWRVRTAMSGAQALEAARLDPPDLIFMDIVMPGMDGFEACRRLAEHPSTRAIPVVFVSTKAQRADQVWARMQGGREVIAKPYTAEHLLSAIERHAGLRDGAL